jgi:HTH-type transcriptional regulator, cell division transcriptional repressor
MARHRSDRIGKALMLRRRALGRSQKEVAKLADTTAAAVSHIERGLRQPSADLLTRLASAVDCSANDLLAGTVSAPRENLHVARVLNAMKSLSPAQQEQIADYCDFLLKRVTRTSPS